MLQHTQQKLLIEIQASDRQLQPHLSGYESELLRICGPAYGNNAAAIIGDPENHWQEWLSIFLPQLVYSNPQCSIPRDQVVWVDERAGAVQDSLNEWATLIDLRHDIERGASDYAVRWACGIVQPEPVAGYEDMEDPPYLPGFTRLSPLDVRWDPTIKDVRKSRWIAHRIVRDIEDVIHEAEKDPSLGWNLDELRIIAKAAGNDPKSMPRGGVSPVNVERKQLVTWELWSRFDRLDGAPSPKRGFFGTVYTVLDALHAREGMGDWIRKPRSYYGPRSGPYAIQGSMLLGDLVAPLAPLVGQTSQAVYLNRISRAIMQAVEDYKKFAVTSDSKLADLIANGEHASCYSADGVDVRQIVQMIETGGVTQQMLTAKADARETLDRNSGLHEAQRGNVTGVATATEINAAQISSGLRSGFLVEKYRDWVRQIFSKGAFYFDMDPDVQITLSDGRRIRGGMPAGTKWSALDHEKLNLRIDPYSMSRTDEHTKQLQFSMASQALNQINALQPPVAMSFNLPWFLKLASSSSGVRDLEQLFDPQLFYAMHGMAMGMQGNAPTPNPQPTAQPRFPWRNIGSGGSPATAAPMRQPGHGGGGAIPKLPAPAQPTGGAKPSGEPKSSKPAAASGGKR